MVPHDAREPEDLDFLEYDDPLIAKYERTIPSTSSNSSASTLFGDDLDIKPEIDTGRVSESCFSFKKLWKYMGPGEFCLLFSY